jgi:hypothetical protein
LKSTILTCLLMLGVSSVLWVTTATSQQTPQTELISHQELIADARQMRDLLESIHPQPYFRGGGKIAFHRRYQTILSAIPREGMTREDFRGLLSPLVASVDDGHTFVYADASFDFAGVPLLFYVVEKDLYVSAVFEESHRQYLGARLRAVEGVGIDELVLRTRAYYGADNIYGTLVQLANYELFLAKKAVLEDLLPEWRDKSAIRVSLLMPGGETRLVALVAGPRSDLKILRPEPGIELPSLDGLEYGWGFLDERQKTAYLRVLRMEKNRETYEKRSNWSEVSEEVQDFYHSLNDNEAELPFDEALAGLPSLTETYTDLFVQMNNSGSESLIIDLRTNIGGWALSADILIYFLYGKEALIDVHRRTNVVTRKLSPEYFADDPEQSLEEMNELAAKRGIRTFNLSDSDYDFSEPDMLRNELLDRAYVRKLVGDDLALSPTFFSEYRVGTHSKFYTPQNVIVLTDSATFSAGFMFAQYLKLLGATVVGSVPSQNIGQMGETIQFKLDNSGLGGAISRSYLVHDTAIPGAEVAARVLKPDYELTYEKLRELGFSRPAAIRYALEIIGAGEQTKSGRDSNPRM